MTREDKIKAGLKFYAIIRRGEHSKTLGGEEGAGQRLGPFAASRDSTEKAVETGSRIFRLDRFTFEVCT
jgi:hypothetical protein